MNAKPKDIPNWVAIEASIASLQNNVRIMCWLTEEVQKALDAAKAFGIPEFETFDDLAWEHAYTIKEQVKELRLKWDRYIEGIPA